MLLDGKWWRFCCVWLFQILSKIMGLQLFPYGKVSQMKTFWIFYQQIQCRGSRGRGVWYSFIIFRSFIVKYSHPCWWLAVLTVVHSGICFVPFFPHTHNFKVFIWLSFACSLTVSLAEMWGCTYCVTGGKLWIANSKTYKLILKLDSSRIYDLKRCYSCFNLIFLVLIVVP